MDSSLVNRIELEHPDEDSSTGNKQGHPLNALGQFGNAGYPTPPQQYTGYPPNAPGQFGNAGYPNPPQQYTGHPPNAPGQFGTADCPNPPQQYKVVSAQPVIVSHQRPADLMELPATDYTAWSVINTFCCCFIFGVVAWTYSCQTSSANLMGRYTEAKQKAKMSLGFNIAATVIGVIASIVTVVLYVVVYSQNSYK